MKKFCFIVAACVLLLVPAISFSQGLKSRVKITLRGCQKLLGSFNLNMSIILPIPQPKLLSSKSPSWCNRQYTI